MIHAAAAAHSVFVQHTQAGDSLARVQHLGLRALQSLSQTQRVSVAMPLIRCIRFSITRSQERSARALCRMTASVWPFFTFTPSKISG